MSFIDKVILVTGASSGIGADAARHLAKLGGKIALVGRNETRLNEVADQIKSAGSPTPLDIVADITNDAERIVNETVNHFGKLDVLINNAGISAHEDFTDLKIESYDHIMNTNLRSVVILTQLSIPHLEITRGNIVNISSVCGMRAIPAMLSYCMSKAALDHFTKCVALEVASKGIRINSVNPGAIKTPIFKRNPAELEILFESLKARHPIGRIGEVADTSAAIAYLASDAASFVTGILLPVDGGALIKSG